MNEINEFIVIRTEYETYTLHISRADGNPEDSPGYRMTLSGIRVKDHTTTAYGSWIAQDLESLFPLFIYADRELREDYPDSYPDMIMRRMDDLIYVKKLLAVRE